MKKIPLTRGYVALVDDEDFERINAFSWYAHESPTTKIVYALRRIKDKETGKQKTYRMHREILNLPDDPRIIVDHLDLNGVNNTKSNLRFATASQNQANIHRKRRKGRTSRYKGVSKFKSQWNLKRPWVAEIKPGPKEKKKHLGYFATEAEAAQAYNAAALEAWGQFARLNKIAD